MERVGQQLMKLHCRFLFYFNPQPIFSTVYLKFSNKKVKEGEFLGMVMLCKLASVLKVRELCVGAFFKTKHSLDLSYTTVDTRSVSGLKLNTFLTHSYSFSRIRWILGFDPSDMVGLKAYNYFHPLDLTATSSCHTNCKHSVKQTDRHNCVWVD